jgi:YHS domain-containing protein
MAVDPSRAVARRSVDGVDYWFCSEECVADFDRDPASYLNR